MNLHTETSLISGGSESNPHTGMNLHTEIPLNNGGSETNPHIGMNLHTEIPLRYGGCMIKNIGPKLYPRFMIPCLQPGIDIFSKLQNDTLFTTSDRHLQ